MTYFNRNKYSHPINVEEIWEVSNINSAIWEWVKEIQNIKEEIISKVYWICQFDSKWIKKIEEAYLLALEELEWMEFKNKDKYINSSKKYVEWMFIKQSIDSLKNKKGYIWDFEVFINILSKYIWTERNTLIKLLSEELVSDKDKEDIKKYLTIVNNNSIEKNWKRELNFDRSIFESSLSIKSSNNIECFYEEDFNWNKNYFSIKTLLNYIDTFWIEIWLFELNIEGIPNDIRKKYFPSLNRKIKVSMYRNIVQDLRDKQEILMYWFKDYELTKWANKEKQSWYIAEKVIELEFRELSELSNYNISIIRWSVWEDQQNKIDLFIVLEDQKTWVTIKDELQITLRTDLSLKKRQIKKRNKVLQTQWDYTESQLINFTLKDLWKKSHVWKYFNRPIWKLSDTLDEVEKTTIRETFKRLVNHLEEKKERLSS